MKILVTGGAGFIGSNVVDAYIGAGHDVVVMDNLSGGKWENLNPRARFYLMDVRSREVLTVLQRERFDIVNHHAAQMSVPASVEDPAYDADVNVLGFINLLEATRKTAVGKVIFISSGGAIYGEADQYPTSESCNPRPLSPYAITKTVSEQYLAFYRHQYALDYTVLRYANVYGPRQIPHGEAGVVAIFMDRLLSGKQCLLYHYPDEPKGMIRDYCFVADVVEANLAAIEKGNAEAVNIATGRETHTRELFDVIFDALKSLKPDIDSRLRSLISYPARAGDLRRSCLVVDKARSVLGVEARHSLTEGINKTIQWRLRSG
ncbi:MAG: NAD-dependent epimerase/dehydratase family protein [Nitrospirae bacterium]|nr:NAD-dependent epimerase/dehydratase family protein [Nitrospirota bacterium]MBF0592905.1 NAD-dependent epimerase/dehydratase family protein [Nitrospirota bacterium]